MTALPSICGTVCKSSVIPFLVPCRKVCLTPTARMLCSNIANVGERKTWTHSEFCTWQNSVTGQEPPKIYIQCSSAGDGQTCAKFGWPPLSNVGAEMKPRRKTGWNLLQCPKVANWSQPLVGRSSPYCEDTRRYCCLTSFLIVNTCLSCEDTARQSCAGAQMAISCILYCQRAACAHFRHAF